MYNHEHERDNNVVAYHKKVFLLFLKSVESRLKDWDENLLQNPTKQVLSGNLQPLIMVTHNEYTFNANDGKWFVWTHEEHNPSRKKGHIQGLVCISVLFTSIDRLGGGRVCEILKYEGDI